MHILNHPVNMPLFISNVVDHDSCALSKLLPLVYAHLLSGITHSTVLPLWKAHTTSTNGTEGVFRGVCLLCSEEQCTGALCTIGNSNNYCRFARQFAYMAWTRISIICSRTSDVCLILTCCFLPSHIKNKACIVYTEMPIRYGSAAKKAEYSSWNKSPNVHIAHARYKVYFMTGDSDRSKRECAIRESNPGHLDGNEIFYH